MSEKRYVWLVVRVASGEPQAVFADEATAAAHVARQTPGAFEAQPWPVRDDMPEEGER